MNHKNLLDWYYYFAFSVYFQTGSALKIALKKALKYVPGAGWACQLGSYLFLNRDWLKDQPRITNYIEYFRRHKFPFQFLFFCEGTNFCSETKEKSDRFAKKNNLKAYDYILHPRTTGFTYIYSLLKGDGNSKPMVTALYDMTVSYVDEAYSGYDYLSGKWTKEVHMLVERFDFDSLPNTTEGLEQWLRDRWDKKEEKLKCFYEKGYFPDNVPRVFPTVDNHFNLGIIIFHSILAFTVFILKIFGLLKMGFLISILAGFILTQFNLDDIIVKM